MAAEIEVHRGVGLLMMPSEEIIRCDLTPREHQIAELVSLGYSSKYVAAKLHISVRTVETHIGSIYRKLGVTCRDELIELRHGAGWWTHDPR